MSVRRIAYHEYEPLVGDWVELPLDYADPWTLQLANLINGRDMTDEEFDRTIALFNAQCGTGVDI